eukprot:gene5058-biopygen4111
MKRCPLGCYSECNCSRVPPPWIGWHLTSGVWEVARETQHTGSAGKNASALPAPTTIIPTDLPTCPPVPAPPAIHSFRAVSRVTPPPPPVLVPACWAVLLLVVLSCLSKSLAGDLLPHSHVRASQPHSHVRTRVRTTFHHPFHQANDLPSVAPITAVYCHAFGVAGHVATGVALEQLLPGTLFARCNAHGKPHACHVVSFAACYAPCNTPANRMLPERMPFASCYAPCVSPTIVCNVIHTMLRIWRFVARTEDAIRDVQRTVHFTCHSTDPRRDQQLPDGVPLASCYAPCDSPTRSWAYQACSFETCYAPGDPGCDPQLPDGVPFASCYAPCESPTQAGRARHVHSRHATHLAIQGAISGCQMGCHSPAATHRAIHLP